ncbi:hypothetical protein ACROYT_G027905 [Oculina patagonica]
MKSRSLVFGQTRSLCIAMLGIAILATSCESTVDLFQPTTPATAKLPQCSFNHINYNVGETWNPFLLPKGYYRCKRCSCKLSSDGSMAIIDCEGRGCKKTSGHANPSPNEQQRSCTHLSTQRNHGTVWKAPVRDQNVLGANQCQECSCTDGYVTCAIRTCPVLSCTNQTKTDGTCCPICAENLQRPKSPMGCQTMGRYYDHMETWYPRIPPRYDMCINCTCKNTSIECRNRDCPKITCDNPQRKPGACCDTCPANSATVKKSTSSPSSSNTKDSIRMLIRFAIGRVRKRHPRIPALFQIRAEKKETPIPGECVWNGKRFPHNSTFYPTVPPFGVVPCVNCFCNPLNSEIKCEHMKCPTSYPCKDPVNIPGVCCKVCEDPTTRPPITNSTNGRTCTSGKHWRVYEYMEKVRRKPQSNTPEVREQFALEDDHRDSVEIHSISANMTKKVVKISNTTRVDFHKMLQNNKDYKYIGKIREVQKNKIKTWEQRTCHHTQGCIHTVRKIMNGLRERVRKCHSYIPRPPDSLLQPEHEKL